MIKNKAMWIATALTGVVMTLNSVTAKPVDIEALAQFPAIERVSLSPDGKHIVGLVAAPGHQWPVISVWKTEAMDERPIWVPTEEMMYLTVGFFGNDKLIWIAQGPGVFAGTKSLQRRLYTADLDGGNYDEPLRQRGTDKSRSRNYSFRIFYEGFIDSDKIYIEAYTDSSQLIYELDHTTGRRRVVAEASETAAFLPGGVNPVSGDLLVRQEIENRDGHSFVVISTRQDKDSPWKAHPELTYDLRNRTLLDIAGFDQNADRLVVITNKETNFAEARIYNIASETWEKDPLFSVPNFDVVATENREVDGFHQVAGVTVGGPSLETFSLHPYWGGVLEQLKAQFPGESVSLYDRRGVGTDRPMAIMVVSSSTRPPEYYLYDDGTLKSLGKSRPWIDRDALSQSKWVTYQARDGLDIPAILSLPIGFEQGKPVPAIIHPHGGPWARDYIGWDASGWIPFLTSRGIAVLQPQYRGSEGLGQKLWKAGDNQWGLRMQDDKDDGAQWLIEQGIADSERIGIFGYSYGGFAAIAASVRENSPYQCAIAGAGVSNLSKLGNLWSGNRLQQKFQGHTVTGMDPIDNVDKASIPIMLYHGTHDRQADTYHSREFYRAMNRVGADIEYTEIDQMWHQLPWWPEWQRQTLILIENFLKSEKCGLL
ncbi:MAG: prolyl oligopeptidase family serine peptidase [Gammaproteobacteria bacterium]|nr:prolyl oligopeptidase family serine peptidase [Gammaproteobacteria bacterium]